LKKDARYKFLFKLRHGTSKLGGTMAVVLNAADEIAVGLFLEK
jgi:1-deoxy-D-xylulose 5-phosphate reductoisomerase